MEELKLFKIANNVDWDEKWLKCCECEHWLTAPIYITENDEHYCQTCHDANQCGVRNKPWENVLDKCVYPCRNWDCREWFFGSELAMHMEMCPYSRTACEFCDETYFDWYKWEEHFLRDHKDMYTRINLEKPIVKMELRNEVGVKRLYIAEYRTNRIYVSIQIFNHKLQLCVAKVPCDDGVGNSKEFKFGICFDDANYKKCDGEYVGAKQLTTNDAYHKTIDAAKWRTARIEIVLNNYDTITYIGECCICMGAMTSTTVPCRNGHQVCGHCATKIQTCPVCREEMTGVTLRVTDLLANINIQCANAEEGCLQVRASNAMDDHAPICEYKGMKCPECDLSVPTNQLRNHLLGIHKFDLHILSGLQPMAKKYFACMGSLFRGELVRDRATSKYVAHVTRIHRKTGSKNNKFVCRLEWREKHVATQLVELKDICSELSFAKNDISFELPCETDVQSVWCMICPSNIISWCRN